MTSQTGRRVVGLILLLATLAALAVFVLALTWPKAGQFQFLTGRQRVKLDPKMQKMTGPLNMAYYSFKGDFWAIERAARAELIAKGYRQGGRAAGTFSEFVIGDFSRIAKRPIVRIYQKAQSISIYRDCRFQPSGLWTPGEKGWVTVRVMGKAPQSSFDRFKAWIGL
jgi:hypothetical protein